MFRTETLRFKVQKNSSKYFSIVQGSKKKFEHHALVMTPQSWRDSYGCLILKPKKLSHSNPSSSHNFKARNNKFPPVDSLSKLEKSY